MTSPSLPSESSPFYGLPQARRPAGLTAICVIAIVLGGLRLLTALFSLGARVMQDPIEKAAIKMQQQPGMPKGSVKAQEEGQKELHAVDRKYLAFTITITVLGLVFGASLLTGGIMTMKMNPTARTFLVTVFAVAIVFEIAAAIVAVFMQLDMAPVMSRMMMANTAKGGPGAEQGAAIVATMAKIMAIVGIVLNVCWALAKIVFYAIGARYLGRPNIRPLFQRNTPDAT